MILFLRRGGLGDTLLTLPVLRALRRRHAGPELVFAGVSDHAAVLLQYGAVDRVVSSEDLLLWAATADRLPPQPRALWSAVRFCYSDDEAVRRLALHAEVSVYSPQPARDDQPLARQWLQQLGLPPTTDPADFLLAPHGDPAPGAAVVLAPGSGSPHKNWPRGNWLELAAALAARDLALAVVSGPAEQERDDPLRWPWPCRMTPLQGLALPQLAAALAGAAGCVGNDSGVTHLAAALGLPVVAVFGPSNPRVYAPQGGHVRVVGTATAGPPEAPVTEVLAALSGLLGERLDGSG